MAVFPCDVHTSLQHEGRKRDARDPTDEANYCEYTEYQERDSTTILLATDIVDTRRERKNDIQDPSHPNESFRKESRAHKICPRKYDRNAKDEDE